MPSVTNVYWPDSGNSYPKPLNPITNQKTESSPDVMDFEFSHWSNNTKKFGLCGKGEEAQTKDKFYASIKNWCESLRTVQTLIITSTLGKEINDVFRINIMD